MRTLAPDHDDGQIADQLNAERFRTRHGKEWNYRRVHAVRLRHNIPSGCPIVPDGDGARGDGLIPLRAAARLFNVTPSAIANWARRGVLETHQLPGRNPLWVRVNAEDTQRLLATQPQPGFQRLQEVAKTLSVTEAELWDDVKSGRRAIRRMQRGRRWEWQVALLPPESQSNPLSPTLADR